MIHFFKKVIFFEILFFHNTSEGSTSKAKPFGDFDFIKLIRLFYQIYPPRCIDDKRVFVNLI